jgi:aromatic ring-opening dioxygenase catalytic subunit (LigB family)
MKQPTFFLSHGGGPWPYLDGDFRQHFTVLEQSLQALPSTLPERPQAVLMVSGHWEAPQFRVMASAQPGMVYDYSGFPACPRRWMPSKALTTAPLPPWP